MRFVKTFGLAGAASIISMNAAFAGELAMSGDDLFDGAILELDEAPMSAADLSEARGGFSVGGLVFNIGVQIPQPAVTPLFSGGSPLPNGVFGDAGSPLPNGVFGNGGNNNDNGNNNASNGAPANGTPAAGAGQPQSATAQNAAPVAAAAAEAAQQAQSPAAANPANNGAAVQPAVTPADSANVSPAAQPAPTTTVNNTAAAPQPAAQPSAQPAAQPTPQPAAQPTPQPAAAQPTPQPQPAAATATTSTPIQPAANPAPAAPTNVASQPAPSAAPQSPATPAPQNNNVASLNDLSPAAPGGNSPQPNEGQDVMPVPAISVANASDDNIGDTDEPTMSMVLSEVAEPEVRQQVGPNGITTIFNNSLNNVRLTARVNMTVQVANYGFVMGMRRSTNLTTQAISQSFFLRGLN